MAREQHAVQLEALPAVLHPLDELLQGRHLGLGLQDLARLNLGRKGVKEMKGLYLFCGILELKHTHTHEKDSF